MFGLKTFCDLFRSVQLVIKRFLNHVDHVFSWTTNRYHRDVLEFLCYPFGLIEQNLSFTGLNLITLYTMFCCSTKPLPNSWCLTFSLPVSVHRIYWTAVILIFIFTSCFIVYITAPTLFQLSTFRVPIFRSYFLSFDRRRKSVLFRGISLVFLFHSCSGQPEVFVGYSIHTLSPQAEFLETEK